MVDELQLRDDVEPDLGELILEHLKEHGEQVVDSSVIDVSMG